MIRASWLRSESLTERNRAVFPRRKAPRSICRSMRNIRRVLELASTSRCRARMPLMLASIFSALAFCRISPIFRAKALLGWVIRSSSIMSSSSGVPSLDRKVKASYRLCCSWGSWFRMKRRMASRYIWAARSQ